MRVLVPVPFDTMALERNLRSRHCDASSSIALSAQNYVHYLRAFRVPHAFQDFFSSSLCIFSGILMRIAFNL